MKRLFNLRLACLAMVLGLFCLGGVGCSTTGENDNRSERPWNQPKSWETGLPGGMNERR
jgi:hypothetical protein